MCLPPQRCAIFFLWPHSSTPAPPTDEFVDITAFRHFCNIWRRCMFFLSIYGLLLSFTADSSNLFCNHLPASTVLQIKIEVVCPPSLCLAPCRRPIRKFNFSILLLISLFLLCLVFEKNSILIFLRVHFHIVLLVVMILLPDPPARKDSSISQCCHNTCVFFW